MSQRVKHHHFGVGKSTECALPVSREQEGRQTALVCTLQLLSPGCTPGMQQGGHAGVGGLLLPPPAPASGVLHSNLWEAQFRLEEQRTHFGTFGEVSLAALKNVCYYHSFPPPPPICCFAGLLLSKERSCLSKQRKGNFLKKKERKGELVRRKAEGGKMHPRVGCFLKLAEKWGEAGLCCWGRVVQQNSLIPNI